MTLRDYPEVYRLWTQSEGICLTEDDGRNGIALYLKRNRGLCFVARAGGKLIGAVLCGHDGRRGIMRHLAISKRFRRKHIALRLVRKSLDALGAQRIRKCNIFVMNYNVAGLRFWEHIGFHHLADDYRTLQIGTNDSLSDKIKTR